MKLAEDILSKMEKFGKRQKTFLLEQSNERPSILFYLCWANKLRKARATRLLKQLLRAC